VNSKELKQFVLIMIIFIAACIETDIYLPAFADMMVFFKVSEGEIQKILTWNFMGLFASSLIYGPISDAYGRRKPLLIALGLFLIGSIITALDTSFNWMLLGRVLQGLGSGGVFTLGSAIIFDVYKEEKAVQALNRMNSIVPFIMASAPIAGGYLNYAYGFRYNFLTIAILVLLSFLCCIFFFEESLEPSKRIPFNIRQILADIRTVGTSIPFWQLTLTVSLLFSGYLVFLSGTAVLFVVEFGINKEIFPYFQGAVLGGYFLGSISCTRAIAKWGLGQVKKTGIVLVILGAMSLIITSWLAPTNPYLLTLAMMPYSFGFLWTQTPYFGDLMGIFPEKKGIAASLLTSARLLLTAGVVGLASQLYNATILPLTCAVVGVVLIILPALLFYELRVKLKLKTHSQ
jgi:DHA1 family bicyclomycin/chloramphenicol resistance-like MFS transporter